MTRPITRDLELVQERNEPSGDSEEQDSDPDKDEIHIATSTRAQPAETSCADRDKEHTTRRIKTA